MTGITGPLFRWTGRLALMAMLVQPGLSLAQTAGEGERRLAPGDEIAVSVSGRPELDSQLTLDAAGRVAIDPVGEVSLTGLSIDEAAQVLRRNLRLYYPDIDTVDVQLRSASEVTLYAIGALRSPGHYDFSAVPSIWELVRAAGGTADDADLRLARVIRQENGETTVFSVDISGVLSGTSLPTFELRNGDTLAVPSSSGDAALSVPGLSGVQVFGGVATPSVVAIDEPTLLMDILMRAGAPAADSDLNTVRWVHQTGGGYIASVVNVRSFLEEGNPTGNPLVHPGDTLEVGISTPSWAQRNLPLILGAIATAATVVLAWNAVVND